MASRILRSIERVESSHGWDFWNMPMRTLERLSDWYGRLCWIVESHERFGARQRDMDSIRRNRMTGPMGGGL